MHIEVVAKLKCGASFVGSEDKATKIIKIIITAHDHNPATEDFLIRKILQLAEVVYGPEILLFIADETKNQLEISARDSNWPVNLNNNETLKNIINQLNHAFKNQSDLSRAVASEQASGMYKASRGVNTLLNAVKQVLCMHQTTITVGMEKDLKSVLEEE